ncbi:sensor histidine kinase [Spirosoma aerolatum]|uniref:sensor histidine kinase n=1 Tax=Spirosoma aerolatum TaxID=1211326 RepID=UPI0009AD0DDC|nr:histidine kinase [Spirosoma aerolatum]
MLQTGYQRLTTFFSKWELWYHALVMPIIFPIGLYYLIGPVFLSDWRVFVAGLLIGIINYAWAVVVLTLLVRQIIARFPDVKQTVARTLVMLGLILILTVLITTAVLFQFSLIPWFGTQFNWPTIHALFLLDVIFDVFLCITLNAFYAYRQWSNDQTENEQLRQATYQNQLDALKMQINPHFLFNSLTSLSSLIGENRQQASQFVDELSKVYRYLLQANHHELVPLQQELDFITSYGHLLQTRYGASLQISYQIDGNYLDASLPALTLQALIDNAMKHNSMAINHPLIIRIQTMPEGKLLVQNSLHRKTNKVEQIQARLTNLVNRYRSLGNGDLEIEETSTHFGVRIPLLAHSVQATY